MSLYEVRNSPLNWIASFSGKAIICLKGMCYVGGTTGTLLGLGLDEILKESGRLAIFKPVTGK